MTVKPTNPPALRQLISESHAEALNLAEDLLLPKAIKGELWAIQNLLLLVSKAIADECPLTPGVAEYVASALRAIYEGGNADDAFRIKRKRGEKDTRRARRKAFMLATSIVQKMQLDSKTLDCAASEVAAKHYVSEDTAKKAWKDHHREVKRLLRLEKEAFGRIQRI
jgi:hypothetical protein